MASPRRSSSKLFLVACCLASSIALAHPSLSPRERSTAMWVEGVRSTSGGGAQRDARGMDWLDYLKAAFVRGAAMFGRFVR